MLLIKYLQLRFDIRLVDVELVALLRQQLFGAPDRGSGLIVRFNHRRCWIGGGAIAFRTGVSWTAESQESSRVCFLRGKFKV